MSASNSTSIGGSLQTTITREGDIRIGLPIGRWEVVGGPEIRGERDPRKHWLCRCGCGKERWVSGHNLAQRKTEGCIACRNLESDRPTDLVGGTHGNWLALELSDKLGSGQSFVIKCRCLECDNALDIKASLLRSKRFPACPRCNRLKSPSRVLSHYWGRLLWAARKRGIAVEISPEEAFGLLEKQGGLCALTGIPIGFAGSTKEHGSGATTASLDRRDSSQGYAIGNVRWVHKHVNVMKMDTSDEEFVDWCRLVVANSGLNTEKENAEET